MKLRVMAAVVLFVGLFSGNAIGEEFSIVGQWMVTGIGPMALSMFSFRDDGTMRQLTPASAEMLKGLASRPKADQEKYSKYLFDFQAGKYFSLPGTWKSVGKSSVKLTLPSPEGGANVLDHVFTTRFLNKNHLSLLREGEPPLMLTYVNVPLPRQ